MNGQLGPTGCLQCLQIVGFRSEPPDLAARLQDLSTSKPSMVGNWLEILKEITFDIVRAAFVFNPAPTRSSTSNR
jgi:hypothetical protein